MTEPISVDKSLELPNVIQKVRDISFQVLRNFPENTSGLF